MATATKRKPEVPQAYSTRTEREQLEWSTLEWLRMNSGWNAFYQQMKHKGQLFLRKWCDEDERNAESYMRGLTDDELREFLAGVKETCREINQDIETMKKAGR